MNWTLAAILFAVLSGFLGGFLCDARSRIASYIKEELRQAERRADEAQEGRLSRQGLAIDELESQNNCLHDPQFRVVREQFCGPHKVRAVKCSACGRQLSVTWPEEG